MTTVTVIEVVSGGEDRSVAAQFPRVPVVGEFIDYEGLVPGYNIYGRVKRVDWRINGVNPAWPTVTVSA